MIYYGLSLNLNSDLRICTKELNPSLRRSQGEREKHKI